MDCAEGGEEALALMKKNHYHIIFLDDMMPRMDGTQTLHALRQIDDYYKHVPVIALTGNYSPTAREEYVSLGFTDFLEEPILIDCLEQIMYQYVLE